MNITLFIGGLSKGGAERVICNLANYLADNEHNVNVLTMSDDEPSYRLSDSVQRIPLLKQSERKNYIYNSFIRFCRLVRYLSGKKMDAYVVMLPTTTELLLSLRGLTRSKIIVSERVDPSSYDSKTQKRLKKLAYKADGYVFQTDEIAKWYEESLTNTKIAIIPNAINEEFVGATHQENVEKVIISAGRLSEQKNFAMLIDAFAKFYEKHNDYTLLVYGEGPLRTQLQKKIEHYGLQDKIKLPGFSKDLKSELSKSSIFVLPSDYEGMPNVLMEAMALGMPCISTDSRGGGARSLIKNGINGILTQIGDTEALTDAMSLLADNRQYSLELGKEAEKIQDRLSSENIYKMWETFIKELCDNRN